MAASLLWLKWATQWFPGGSGITSCRRRFVPSLMVPSLVFLLAACEGPDPNPGITVSPTNNLITSESGNTAQFTIVLTSEPNSDVTIALQSTNENEGIPQPVQAVFNGGNWKTPQTITLTGQDDDGTQDGDIHYTVVTVPAVSGDSNYNGMNAVDVLAINLDNDGPDAGKPVAQINISPRSLQTDEGGSQSGFNVSLSRAPEQPVTVTVINTDISEGIISPDSLTFDNSDWFTDKTFTVTGVNDDLADGDITYSITFTVASGDPDFNGINLEPVQVTNDDDEVPATNAGVILTPSSDLLTSEDLGSATFTVKLNSAPMDIVTIELTSSDSSEGQVNPSQLQFSAADFGVAQAVTVTGVDDTELDGNINYQIQLTANSTDPDYNNLIISPVQVSNLDNDTETTAAVLVTLSDGSITSETGSSIGINVALAAAPATGATVTIAAISSSTGEGLVTPATIAFSADNWAQAQTFTVTGQDDSIDDGNIDYQISFTASSDNDAAYNGININPLTLTNTDDDSAGFDITARNGLTTSEDLTSISFDVLLSAQPVAPVSINLLSSDTTEAMVNPSSLSFDASNWNTTQSFTVTGLDDDIPDGNITYQIQFTVVADPSSPFATIVPPAIELTNLDNEPAGVTITPTTTLTTTEAQTSASFTVALNSQPNGDVSIALSSSDNSEGLVNPASLSFTTTNWNQAQTVTVTGQDDALADGDINYQITFLTSAATGDPYNGIGVTPVNLVNSDDEQAQITLTTIAGLTTSEDQTSVSVDLSLSAEPTADVIISIISSDTTEGVVNPSALTFNPSNWSQLQSVSVTGQDDNEADGDTAYQIQFSVSSTAGNPYNALPIPALDMINLDNEQAGITISPRNGLSTAEPAGNTTFSVVLDTPPSDTVTLSLSSSDISEGSVSPNSLIFTVNNWSQPQTVTVNGQNDDEVDGDIAYQIEFSVSAVTNDPYNGFSVAALNLSNSDDEQPSIIVTPSAGLITSESLSSDSFTVALGAMPMSGSTVTILASSNDGSEGTVTPGSVNFNSTDWNQPRTFTVTGVDDPDVDGDISYQINLSANSAAGNPYNGYAINPVQVINTDNDSAQPIISVDAPDRITAEDGRHVTFSIRLDSRPDADVLIDALSNDPTEGIVSPRFITFTTDNWQQAQIYRVTGMPDSVVDGDTGYQIGFTSQSLDIRYDNLSIPAISMSNLDDDGGAVLPIQADADFTLYIEPGIVNITDKTGNLESSLPAWAYSPTTAPTNSPGPVLEVTEGQTVILDIVNDHLHDHGFGISRLFSDPEIIIAGDYRRYIFTAPEAGIYLINDPWPIARSMGLFGAMVVKPATANTAWNSGPSYDQERTWIVTDMDDRWLSDPENPTVTATYSPNYFLLNGMSGFAAKDAVNTTLTGNVGDVFLVRIANAGQYDQSLHFHANHFQLISQDGVKVGNLSDAAQITTVNVKHGSTAMVLYTLDKPGTYPVHVHSAQMEASNGVYLNGVMTHIVAQ